MQDNTLPVLERRISAERLAPYRAAAAGNLGTAVALYEWNTEVAAAFWAVLADVEVVLRNSLHEQLTAWSGRFYATEAWYLDPGQVFNSRTAADIATARRRVAESGRRETPGRVVAELSLGFWRYLLANRYERSLWLPCLRQAFPGLAGRGMRRDVDEAVRELHALRNRVAHHEPIHNRQLGHLHQRTLTMVGWICQTSHAWIARRSAVPAVLARRPVTAVRA